MARSYYHSKSVPLNLHLIYKAIHDEFFPNRQASDKFLFPLDQ